MNIMITEFNGESDVCVFSEKQNIDVGYVKTKLDASGQKYTDVFEVKDKELEFYCYEPYWL